MPLGPLETEAKAKEEGIQFAWDVGIRNVVLESDSQIVISALIGSSEPPVVIANIIEGIHQKLYEFRKVQFSHVKRLDFTITQLIL